MIPQITEINFPKYATLSTATATLVDMGDKTITAQVKIDGSIVPDFSYDWEIEFQGERYIHPLREPQASKGNESISSVIDLTFYHKGIYDLKRHFFVSTAETEAGTIMADKYIVPLTMNIGKFVEYLNKVLKLYYGQAYHVDLNPEYEYDETDIKYIDINYTKIWDIFTHFYEWFGVRWVWATSDLDDNTQYYTIKVGYPSQEVSHIFQYGFEGGLLKFERQVQDGEIRNQMFGRGGSQNLPYRYFKNVDPNNPDWKADPDWIPELASIYFSELRGKSFRDYVRGWKAKHYGGQSYFPTTDAYIKGYTDEQFNPVDYVEDEDSIAKYGLIQGGLDNNEEIFPTIQKRDLGNGLGRADEIVDVETILVDEPTSNTEAAVDVEPISEDIVTWYDSAPSNDTLNMTVSTKVISISDIKEAHIVKDTDIEIVQHVRCVEEFSKYDAVNNQWHTLSKKTIQKVNPLKINSIEVSYINNVTGEKVADIANIEKGTAFYIVVTANVSGFVKKQTNIPHPDPNFSAYTGTFTPDATFKIITSVNTEIDYTPIHGIILGNYTEGVNRISKSVTIGKGNSSSVLLETKKFEVGENGATSVDVPTRIISTDTTGSYTKRTTINARNLDTTEVLDPSNLPQGRYVLQVQVDITNNSTASQTYKVELLPAYIYYPYDSAKWRPTFDIWIKDIWGSTRLVDANGVVENDTSYADRVWIPILGDRKGEEAKVVFSSGSLSGYSDWEFPIVAYAFDDSKSLDGVPSHWRLTLAKSDAEVDASSKWIPSIQTQTHAGDHFYFIGIDMPHQYVLWAEEEVDKWKRENMPSQIKPTFVIQTDKVRLNELQEGETRPLLNSLRIGNSIRATDFRFIEGDYETLHLQSVTYTWDESTIILPNIEVVLSDKVVSDKNPIEETKLTISKISLGVSEIAESTKKEFGKFKRISKGTESQVLSATILATSAQTTAKDAQDKANKVSTSIGAYDVQITRIIERLEAVEESTGIADLTELKAQVSANTESITKLDNKVKVVIENAENIPTTFSMRMGVNPLPESNIIANMEDLVFPSKGEANIVANMEDIE